MLTFSQYCAESATKGRSVYPYLIQGGSHVIGRNGQSHENMAKDRGIENHTSFPHGVVIVDHGKKTSHLSHYGWTPNITTQEQQAVHNSIKARHNIPSSYSSGEKTVEFNSFVRHFNEAEEEEPQHEFTKK